MRKYLFLFPLLLFGFAAQAQESTALATFNWQQKEVIQYGMLTLGGWAIANIILGSFKLTQATRSRKYFYQMSLYWNIANLCIASAALYFLLADNGTNWQLQESLRMHSFYKKILYLNLGLDVSYMLLGAYLKERSRAASAKYEQLQGWGQAIVLQGFFLLMLDLIMVVFLETFSGQLFRLVPQV